MLLEQYIERLDEISPDYPDVKESLDKVALAANKANDNISKLVIFILSGFWCYAFDGTIFQIVNRKLVIDLTELIKMGQNDKRHV
jgi:hypothetical protein